ncbi:MAG: hypothetical protein ACI9XK_000583 [Granulosicoccus sp.]|jgi:hypothetical protein
MNPLLSTAEERQFPPLSEVKITLKIDWYRCPIDRKVLAKLIARDDARGLFKASGHLTLWIVTGALCFYFFMQSMWLTFFITLFLHGTVASFFPQPIMSSATVLYSRHSS